MSISIPTPENLKSKAKLARKFLKEKCNVELSHSQCLELISQIFGFRDWNTATAEVSAWDRMKFLASLRSKAPERPLAVEGITVGELRKALEKYDDSSTIDADYEFNLGQFMNSIEDIQNPEDTIHQEFAITALTAVDDDYANLKLELKEESCTQYY